ncbi:MAG: acyl-CoA dehydrogenase family protein [Pseudomonadota bacterium]
MDFALGEEALALMDVARRFGEAHIAPNARAWETAGEIPKSLWKDMAELGLGGLTVPESFGGAGLSRLEAGLVVEALARSCPSVTAFLSIHNMCAGLIAQHGSDPLRARCLGPAIAMDMFLAYCLTEPTCGSDAAALRTRAERTERGWRLTGNKAFISGGGYADAYIVMARSGGSGPSGISAFVVEDGMPGLSFGALEEKMGWRAQPTRAVHLDACALGADALLGEEGSGFSYAMAALDGGRLSIAACSLGGAQAALDQTLRYVQEREAFGRRLADFQALQFRLAEMEIEMAAARVFLRQAAWTLDQGAPDATKTCAMAKKFVTEVGSRVADQCLQLHGGYGYLADYGLEKIVRDLRVHQILEGTSEVMQVITARAMLGQ